MSLFVIGDLHLALSVDKPMDIFGASWQNHVARLSEGFQQVAPTDTVVLLGDLSWGLSLAEARADLQFIDNLSGDKLFVKGNHDYWWSTVQKMMTFLQDNDCHSIRFLHNNAYVYEDIALCGTRGWFYEEKRASAQDEKVFLRELGRLRSSLNHGASLHPREIICFLHYPPLYEGYRCDEIVDMMNEFGVKRCYYGHLHGGGRDKAIEGNYKGIEYTLVSADHVQFSPVQIKTN